MIFPDSRRDTYKLPVSVKLHHYYAVRGIHMWRVFVKSAKGPKSRQGLTSTVDALGLAPRSLIGGYKAIITLFIVLNSI